MDIQFTAEQLKELQIDVINVFENFYRENNIPDTIFPDLRLILNILTNVYSSMLYMEVNVIGKTEEQKKMMYVNAAIASTIVFENAMTKNFFVCSSGDIVDKVIKQFQVKE